MAQFIEVCKYMSTNVLIRVEENKNKKKHTPVHSHIDTRHSKMHNRQKIGHIQKSIHIMKTV